MQRNNKYRGQAVDTKEWVYGNLIGKDWITGDVVDWDADYICLEKWNRVIEESVGQYTGLMDNSEDVLGIEGVEVCEDDIVQFSYKINGKFEWITAAVKYECGVFILSSNQLPDGYIVINEIAEQDGDYCWIDGIVSGNIFDNPELLQEVE